MKLCAVHTGTPSWHQRRAGHGSSGVTVFTDRYRAEEYVRKCKEQRPNEPAYIIETEEFDAAAAAAAAPSRAAGLRKASNKRGA